MKLIAIQMSFFLILSGCVSQFVPRTSENPELLVVEALISDDTVQTVKLGSSLPLGLKSKVEPVSGCIVSVTDDKSSNFSFSETDPGIYKSGFTGEKGRFYKLHIQRGSQDGQRNYESSAVEMKPVPPIDSLYYEKVLVGGTELYPEEGCRIFLDTHDPSKICDFYRWEFTETWQFQLPYEVPNQTCWITAGSDNINIKSTASLASSTIIRNPINYITNETDRLKIKYSILVNQYSLNEDEYSYWEKLQNLSEQVGGLYDIIPSSVPSNIYCIEDPGERVLGYFSVSAVSSKRIFIKENFRGLVNLITDDKCIVDTVFNGDFIPHLNETVWVIISHQAPDYKVITVSRVCGDCTARGTTVKPAFWQDKN